MSSNEVTSITLKEIVTGNFHAAAVFEKYSLDFCCRGGKTIGEACADKGIDAAPVIGELMQVAAAESQTDHRFAEWAPEFLIDFIMNNHHAYVRKMIPVLLVHTKKIASVHGMNHPELLQIEIHFDAVAKELAQHMQKEEMVLFPYIRKLLAAKREGTSVGTSPFGSVSNPIRMMEAEHQNAGDELYHVRSLSSGYTVPDDGCTTYRVAYQELQDFERDLHQHVHLENNILFPLAIALEEALIARN